VCCNGSCVSPTTSDACGACGRTCPGGYVCQDSACVTDAGVALACDGADAGCPSGTACPLDHEVCYPTACAGQDFSQPCWDGTAFAYCSVAGSCP
jgi:hypothetical protein